MKSRRLSTPVTLAVAALTAATVAAVPAAPALASGGGHGNGRTGAHAAHGAARGKLLRARPVTSAAALPSAARNTYVEYVSEGAGGEAVTVSGTVSVPKTAPPRGGWPVISWAHGTTGVADVCAPSADEAGGPAHDYIAAMRGTLDAWLRRGYAVVQTDYEGLGTPGGHPYLNGLSEANSAADIVRAARRLDRRIGRDWIVTGHSQGGQAALYTAATQARPRDVRLLGAVAIAPGGVDVDQVAEYVRQNLPGARHALAFLPTLLLGAAAADPRVVPGDLLTDRAEPLLAVGRTACQAQINEAAAKVPAEEVFEPGADLGPLTRYLRTQDPIDLTLRVPVLVAQGTADVLVGRPTTDRLVGALCTRYPKIAYRVYEGADHRAAVPGSFEDAARFAGDLRAGRAPAATC